MLIGLLGSTSHGSDVSSLLSRKRCLRAAAVVVGIVVAASGLSDQDTDDSLAQPPPQRTSAVPDAAASERPVVPPPTPAVPSTRPAAAPPPRASAAPTPAAAPLLVMATGGDGDSWRDTNGVEYRMGLVNTPETDECGGAAATAYRKRALAGGFRAAVYATDDYSRKVSVIRAPDGSNLNVAMARDGIADDRYLAQFRHENPALAAELDGAFREARAARRGIWSACSASAPAPAPLPVAAAGCHPDYRTCIPVKGDGSGRGAANDLDCGEIGHPVHLREIGRDPYRLDGSDADGVGCE